MTQNKKGAFIISRLPQSLKDAFLKAVEKQETDTSKALRGMIENYVKYNG